MVWIVYTAVSPDSDQSKGGQNRSRDDRSPLSSVSTSSLRRERKVVSPSLSDSRCMDKSSCDIWEDEQVRCGSVFVSPTDTVQHIKTSVLTTHISPNRKKKSSKHALAIGSSFGHVHAFLRDDNYVLQELEKNRAKEQCLMLIKKPKSSSKQMLKSQSWTNLSVSDSHLYKQLDGGYNTSHRRNHKYRMKRKQSDLQPMPPESTDESESVDNISPRSSSNSDDGGFLRHREREKRWTDSRTEKSKSDVLPYKMSLCNSTKSDGKSGEINNNKSLKNSGRLYRSQNDIYLEAPRLVEIDVDDDKCRIKSDEFYSPEKMPENSPKSDTENQDPMSRCHSLGDLTTGLTLSLVGQRKAESIQSLPLKVQPKPRLHYEKRKSEMSSNYSKKLSNQRDKQDARQNQKQALNDVQTKHFNSFNGCNTPKNSEKSSPIENSENYTQPKIYNENSHQGLENGFSVIQHQALRANAKNKTDILPDKSYGFDLVKSEKDDDDASDKSNQSSRSSNKTPVKTRRSLPMVPQGSEDLLEKKKRYTDIVKMRMSVHSRNSRNSNSRQSVMSSNSETPPKLLHADETPSDREVSDLLRHKNKTELSKSSSLNIGDCVEMTNGNIPREREHLLSNTNENVNTTLPSSVRSCDSGHTTVTSLSSTMDSGYLTNDAENDMYSTSSYTRSLQRSAHSLYSASKLNNFTYGSMPRKDSSSVSVSKVNGIGTHSDNSENVHVKRIPSQSGDLLYSQVNTLLSAGQCNLHNYDKVQESGSGSVQNQETIGSNYHDYNNTQESNSGNVRSPETNGHRSSRISQVIKVEDVKHQTQKITRCPPEGAALQQPQTNNSQYSQELKEKLINRMREHASANENTANDYKCRSNVYNQSVQNNVVQNNMMQNVQETQNSTCTTTKHFGFEGTSPPYRSSSGLSQSRGNVKNVRRDSMENLSKKDENFQVQNFSASKGLSYSYTLPRASNSSYRGGNSGGNVNCGTQQVKNYSNNNDLNGDEQLPNFGNSTFAPVHRQQRAASEMLSLRCPEHIYPVAGNLASSSFNKNPTSVTTKPTQLQYNGQNFVAKTVSHDYVNVQGHDLRSGLKVSSSVNQTFVNNQNMCNEYRRGWKECDNFQSLSNPHNKIAENWKPEQSSGYPSENTTVNTPSLCQLLQKYDFHLCQIKLGENSTVSDFIRLLESSVTLPAVKSANEKKDNSVVYSPQGKCAQLGGPGSAFKPVKTVSSSTTNYTMTTVANIASHLPPACDLGGLQKGDLIIEVNELLVMCKPLSTIKEILESQPGDMMLLISRQKQDIEKELLMKKNTEIDLLKNQLKKMNLEMQKKTKAIQELNALLPWKQTGNKTKEINGNHLGNEFIVNGLSEDEFIV